MLIIRYIVRETFKAQLAVFLVLMTIFLSQQFIQILAEASDGQLPAELIVLVLGLQLPSLAALILPISFFLGILFAQGRMYSENEMTVLHACGVSEWYVARVTLFFGFAMALFTALLTLWWGPSALSFEQALAERARSEAGVSVLQTGRFQEIPTQRAVVFIEQQTADKDLENIFLVQLPNHTEHEPTLAEPKSRHEAQPSLVKAQAGQVLSGSAGAQTLLLEKGRRYSINPDEQEYHVMRFDSYQMQIKEQESEEASLRLESVPTLELLQSEQPDTQAELQWRLAIPLGLPLLALIAVPLSRVNPRQGKFGRMAPAILIYLGYFMVLMAAKRAIAGGRIPVEIGLWWVHICLFIIGCSLLMRDRPIGHKLIKKVRRQK